MVEWIVPSTLSVCGVGLAAYVAYTRNDKELTSRVTAVEVQQENDGKSLERIESTVGKVEQKVDKVLDYLLEQK